VFTPLYPRWSNTVYRVGLVLLLVILSSPIVVPMIYVRTTYNTNQFVPWAQPVEFDHRHHNRDDGIECLYCHSSVERSANAGVPSTGVCMGCHSQIWNKSPLLDYVRASYFAGKPINWKRVNEVPDFVYFNHSVHVTQGIDCVNCHGDVSQMARVMQVQPLTMGWCVDCHRRATRIRAPTEPRPRNAWEASVAMFDPDPAQPRTITPLTTCTACHR
jgi:hypothetical protein